MERLWDQPYLFFTLCFGAYFYFGSRRAFADDYHKVSPMDLLTERRDGVPRRGILKGLLCSVPDGVCPLSWLMMFTMLRQGGAGCLFWYAAAALLWLRPLGALAALRAYYRAEGGPVPCWAELLDRARTRTRRRPWPWAGCLLRLLQGAILCCLLFPIGAFAPEARPTYLPGGLGVCLAAAGALWLLCRQGGHGAQAALSALFLAFLGAALLGNLANIIPAIHLVVRDAFQINTFLFTFSGAGLLRAMGSGAQLNAGSLVMQSLSDDPALPPLPHPAHYSAYAQLRGAFWLLLQLTVGLLYLCAQIVPRDNGWSQAALYCFLCVFGIEFFARTLKRLSRVGPRPWVLAGGCVLAVLLLLGRRLGMDLVLTALWGCLWAASLGTAFLLLFDSGWYFILLEHYRAVYLLHIEASPHIETRFSRK